MESKIEALVASYLAGDLDESGQRLLEDHLRSNEEDRREFLGLLRQAGLLDALLGSTCHPDFPKAVLDEILARRDKGRFVQTVSERLENKRPSTRRKLAHAGRWPQQSSAWPLVVAASALLGLIVVWAFGSAGSRSAGPERTARRAADQDGHMRERQAAREEAEREEARRKKLEEDRARAVAAQEKLALELVAMEGERRKLEAARKDAQADADRRRVEEDLAQMAARFREKAAEFERAKEAAAKAEKELPQATPPVPAHKVQETIAALAKVGRVEGEAYRVVRGEKKAAETGQEIRAGQGIETGEANSFVEIIYPDESRLEMRPGTLVRELKAEGGKRLTVEKGTLRAEVKKQPRGQPMVFVTAHGEATVLGTTLRIYVDPDPKKGMRLEVEEGKVELKNLAGKTVDVPSGHYAVAAVGVEFVAKAMPIEEILLLPKQGKISGVEWGIVHDKQAISGFALETIRDIIGIGNPKVSGSGYFQRKKVGSYVTFTFKADANKDYYVLIRGWCMATAKRKEYDAVDIEVIGGQFVVPGPPFDLPGQDETAVYFFDGFCAYEGYAWVGGQLRLPANSRHPAIVRFSQAGQQRLRLYSEESPMRVDAIWLSATQKEWPDPSCQGPGKP